jgi:hypothetical protein
MDTGTSLVFMPNAAFSALAAAIHAQVDQTTGMMFIDCATSLPTIALRLGGKDYAFAMEDLVANVTQVNSSAAAQAMGVEQGHLACMLPFMPGQDSSELGQDAPMIIVSRLLNSSEKTLTLTIVCICSSAIRSSSLTRPSLTTTTSAWALQLRLPHRTSRPCLMWSTLSSRKTSCLPLPPSRKSSLPLPLRQLRS